MQKKNNYFNIKNADIKIRVSYSCVSSESQQKINGERRNRATKPELKNNPSKSAGMHSINRKR